MSAAITGTASAPGSREVELSIRGMTCAACAARVERKLSALDDVSAAVNFATETATVTAPESVPVARLIEAVERAGYGADLARPRAGAVGPAEEVGADAARVAYLRRRLIVALVFFVPLTRLVGAAVAVRLVEVPRLAVGPGRASRSGRGVGGVAIPRGGAEERQARHRVDGHAGVDGHRGGVRLVGVCHVRAGPRAGPGQAAAAAAARLRRRDLPGGRRVGDHVLAGRAVVRGPGAARCRGRDAGAGRRRGAGGQRPGRRRDRAACPGRAAAPGRPGGGPARGGDRRRRRGGVRRVRRGHQRDDRGIGARRGRPRAARSPRAPWW